MRAILKICSQIEGHLHILYHLVCDVKDIDHALLISNRRLPSPTYNHATKVNVKESEIDKLIADVASYYESMRLKPCFTVSPTTRPSTFSRFLLKAGFKLMSEDDAMVYKGKNKDFKPNPEVKVTIDDGSLTDVWTDVSMKGFGIPLILRDAFIDMYKKASQDKGAKAYLGYFQGKPAGSCALCSFNSIGGIFTVATVPEYRRKGVALALLCKAIADSFSVGNSLLYLITTKGSDAERLYRSLGFEVAYTQYRYEFQ
jgi:ribosomal protein S18 acetylase RimI-like enzyme